MNSEIIGIIDLGSNSCRMVLYAIHQDGAYQPIFEMKRRIRLADYLDQHNHLHPEGLAKAINSTQLFIKAGELYGVTQWIAVATAAVRQSTNQAEIVRQLNKQTGLSFRVLAGDEEGTLGYLGVINTLHVPQALLFDVGGASTELMAIRDRRLLHVTSIPFGALNLTAQFSMLPSRQASDAIYHFMHDRLMEIPWFTEMQNVSLIGIGGAARALAKLERGPKERVHGYQLSVERLKEMYNEISSSSPRDLLKLKGISKRRADVLVASIATIQSIAEQAGSRKLIISRSGLREGLMFQYMLRDQTEPIVESVLEHSLANFKKLYQVNPTVSARVTHAALYLFDSLAGIHGFGARERKLLRITAEIETCGTHLNTEKSARHAAYLVLVSHLHGLQKSEYETITDLLCSKKDPAILKLSLLLRMARFAVFDAGIPHEQLTCTATRDQVLFGKLPALADLLADATDSDLSKDFTAIFHKKLVFVKDAH